MKKDLDPKVITISLVVAVLLIGGIVWYFTSGPRGEAAKSINSVPTLEEFNSYYGNPQNQAPAMPTAPNQNN